MLLAEERGTLAARPARPTRPARAAAAAAGAGARWRVPGRARCKGDGTCCKLPEPFGYGCAHCGPGACVCCTTPGDVGARHVSLTSSLLALILPFMLLPLLAWTLVLVRLNPEPFLQACPLDTFCNFTAAEPGDWSCDKRADLNAPLPRMLNTRRVSLFKTTFP